MVDTEQASADRSEPNPEEQEQLARDIGAELTDFFAGYVRGEVSFADLTFLTYEALGDLFVIASGDYELATGDDETAEETAYDIDDATAEQEELAQEPSRPSATAD